VLFEERAVGRIAVDVDLIDVDALIVQETPGVLARCSGGLGVEDGLHVNAQC